MWQTDRQTELLYQYRASACWTWRPDKNDDGQRNLDCCEMDWVFRKSYTGCFKKVARLKLFGMFSLQLSLFALNFANLLAIYIHIICTKFCRFILIFHQMAYIFPRVVSTRRFYTVNWVFAHKMKMQCTCFGNDVNFSSSRVLNLKSDNCKQSITVWFLLSVFYWHRFNAWYRAYQWENFHW